MKVWWITHLLERITELSEDAVLVEHLALESLLVIIMDPLSYVRWQFMERHILLHLLILKTFVQNTWWFDLHGDTTEILQGWCQMSHLVTLSTMCLLNLQQLCIYSICFAGFFSSFKWITNSFVMGISKQWSRTKVPPFVYHPFCFILWKSPGKGHGTATKSIR